MEVIIYMTLYTLIGYGVFLGIVAYSKKVDALGAKRDYLAMYLGSGLMAVFWVPFLFTKITQALLLYCNGTGSNNKSG